MVTKFATGFVMVKKGRVLEHSVRDGCRRQAQNQTIQALLQTITQSKQATEDAWELYEQRKGLSWDIEQQGSDPHALVAVAEAKIRKSLKVCASKPKVFFLGHAQFPEMLRIIAG